MNKYTTALALVFLPLLFSIQATIVSGQKNATYSKEAEAKIN